MLLGLWLPLALILQLSYKCNLNAMLTTQTAKIPFENVEDLISHKGEPRIMVGEATTIENVLKV